MGTLGLGENNALYYRGRYDPLIIDAIREIPGRAWHSKAGVWSFPANKENVFQLTRYAAVRVLPEVWEFIRRRDEAMLLARQMKDQEKPDPLLPLPIADVEPFAHQVRGFNIAVNLFGWANTSVDGGGMAFLWEQGTGKTLVTIALAGRGYLDGYINKVLIVCPVSVIPVWGAEFDKADYAHEVKLLTESMVKRVERLDEFGFGDWLHVAVTNYEAVWREPFFSALKRWSPDLVVADESQKIKGHTTKQARGVQKLGDEAQYRLILTGTPVTANPLDFYSQYRFIDPNIFGKSYFAFSRRYAVFGGYEGREIVGFQNKEDLVSKAHSIAHRVSKEDALDLPTQVNQELYCELEPKAQKYYQELLYKNVTDIEAMVQEGKKQGKGQLVATNVLTRLLRLQQITGGFVPASEQADGRPMQVSNAKLNLLRETLEDLLGAGHKVVVFARFIPEINAILSMVRDTSFNGVGKVDCAYIYGAVSYEDRGKMVEDFQTDPNCRVFVAQIQTAGLGITLHAADKSILYSLDFNYANYDQCKARVHRIGQNNKVSHIHLLAKNTVDCTVYGVLKQKKNMADDVVDNWRKYLMGD